MKTALTFTTLLGVCLSATPAHTKFQFVDGRHLKKRAGQPFSMKCLVLLAFAAGLLFLYPAKSQAQAPPPVPPLEVDLYITGQAGPVANQIDQVKGDTDPKLNNIGFDLKFNCGANTLEAKGHAVQSIPPAPPTPAGPASALFDDLTLTNTCAQTQSGSMVVYSSNFFPAIAVFAARARLWGKYVHAPGGKAFGPNTKVSVSSTAYNAQTAIAGNAMVADNGPPPVDFGPRVNPFNANNVISVVTTVNFTLDPLDRIVLTGSAATIGYTADRIITVTTAEDLPDLNPGAGCTGCSLRQAMVEADLPPSGIDSTAIQFNIPGASIPVIKIDTNTSHNYGSMGNSVHPVIVDGTTQPGGAMVEIDGRAASSADAGGNPIHAFELDNRNSGIIGLDIHSFPNDAIQISASGAPVTGTNAVLENLIGTDPTGTIALPNGGDAVHILQQPSNVVMDNIIVSNVGQGIAVDGSAATGNLIQWNQEMGNASGILLTNGANNSQSPPTLTSASTDGFNVDVSGTVHSIANSQVTLNVFANSKCDSTGAGQAEELLGLTLATTDANGNANFSDSYAANLPPGEVVTATVTDPNNNTSQLSSCLAITATSTTQPPVANAGSNQTVTVGTLVTLNGSGSSDPNTPPLPLTYHWTQTSGPAVTLTGANTATPSLTPTQTGNYVFSLVVNNGVLDSTAASVTITVTAKAPIANAGSNQTVTVGTLVTLNGTGSSDPNTPPLPLTYQWTQTSGPAVTLTGASTATPSFTPTPTGSYVFSLVVNNGLLNSAAASVTITVTVASPVQLIEALIAEVKSLGLPRGLENRLLTKLNVAEIQLNHGHPRQAIHQLNKFIEEVEDQRGKKISNKDADKLIADARQIIAIIESSRKLKHGEDDE
jgi:hypothetical protein